MQQDAPLPGRVKRGGPGMPLEFQDPEEQDDPRSERKRFAQPRGSWWRPSTKAGRILLGSAVVVVLAVCTTAVMLTARYLERDARFRIAGSQNIESAGLVEVNRAQMLPVFGEDIGRNLFFVPLDARRKQLEQIPWVEHATVMRLLPDHIRISVVERTPVAFTRRGQQVGLVDGSGVLLSMSPATMAQHHYSFPVVTGINPGDSSDARRDRMAVYGRMMAELDAGGAKNSEQLSEIDLTDPEDARALMPAQGGDILAHFGEDHFLDRFERYQAHIAEWRQQYPHLAAVDLRYDNQVVLQMASGSQTAALGDGAPAKIAEPGVSAPAAKPSAAKPSAATSGAKTQTHPSTAKKSKPAPPKKTSTKHAAAKTGKHTAPSKTANTAGAHKTSHPAAAGATSLAQGGN